MPFEFTPQMQSGLGLVAFIAIAWALSERKTAFSFSFAGLAVAVQFAIAALLLFFPPARQALASLTQVTEALQAATIEATSFVFGYVGGAPAPFETTEPGNAFSFAFMALPLIIFMSALSAVLWHWGVLKVLVQGLAFLITRAFRVGGAIGLGAAANVLFGQTEAPLFVRAYLAKFSRSELFMLLTAGMSTVAGTTIVLYATLLENVAPSILGHIIVASLISVPAAILMARVMTPPEKGEIPTPPEAGEAFTYEGPMDAFMTGVSDGMKLYVNIIASLIAFLAVAALINICLAAFPDVGGEPITMQRTLGWLFAPIMWLAGVPWEEASAAGRLMGVKTILNELVAYLELARLGEDAFTERTRLIIIYALCGFANIGSLGINIGGFSALIPERRSEIIALAPRALVAGTLATLSTGAVIGVLWTP